MHDKTSKKEFYEKLVDENKNSRERWKGLKTILPNAEENTVDLVMFEDLETAEASLIATKFNNYFVKSIDNIVTLIPKFKHEEEILNKIQNKVVLNKFNVISMNELKKIVNNLNNTSSEEDGISTRVLKDATEDRVHISNIEPEEWKGHYANLFHEKTTGYRDESPKKNIRVQGEKVEIGVEITKKEGCDEYGNRSNGLEGIYIEMLENGSEKLFERLRLEAVEMNVLRRSSRTSRREHVPNEVIKGNGRRGQYHERHREKTTCLVRARGTHGSIQAT
ncbi:hypothetical protein HHI36_003329 [Cryptolaemus montrouzieri]|uniref:Uncharacterized protein n=1 Tax=Cryptolaemus montrouzieri TaxID=559131 RepID=A0ABD2PD38_9CUCU